MGKKIDHYGQILLLLGIVVLAVGGIVEEGYLFVGFFLLLPLGLWQMISAAVQTYHAKPIAKKPLIYYWRACAVSLLLFTVAFLVRDYKDNIFAMTLAFTGIGGGVITAVYYLYIYKKYLLNGKHEEENNSAGGIG